MRSLSVPLLATCLLAAGAALVVGVLSGSAEVRRGGLPVVATTTQMADLVRQVGGAGVQVHGLLAPNADPHEHEVTPGDIGAIAGAAVVVRSGGDVDDWLSDALASAGGDPAVVDLGRSVRLSGEDPHWWQDPRNVQRAAGAVGNALAAADPAGAAAFRSRARAYARRVRAADAAIGRCWSRVPARERRLVTTHDSYGYYARRYGLTVVGTVIPSLSSRAQPSARELARLVRTIRGLRIRAIFSERALNARVEQAVARDAGASVGRPLWGDALGPRGSAGATYLGALESDTRTLLDGLAGRPVTCTLPAAPREAAA